MRRKIRNKNRIGVDARHQSEDVQKLINHIMWEGKKSVAERIVYAAFEEIKKKEKTDEPLNVFTLALQNVSPSLEVRSRRVGGATYQVPREVRPDRRKTLALRWIIQAARGRKGKPMAVCLAEELLQAAHNEGAAFKKKEDTLRMAEANRAFAHFAW
ncbi:MAG: 30S ribosomal protein S7 [Parcubacteria group bacterium]|nr:30S ribosomal protein S7 [Parcubacteria group bacterium]MBI2175593.1 30S ribosomal protein S7 [Parcubacteria group bacterium]